MKRFLVAAGLLLLAGCSQHGNSFDINKVSELQPGVSTEQDAIAKLGQPASMSNQADGSQLLQWQYVYATAVPGVHGGAHASILFDKSGKMVRVTHLSSPDGVQMAGTPPATASTQSETITPPTSGERPKFGVSMVKRSGPQIIESVASGSPAEASGLKVGDVVTACNGKPVSSFADFRDATLSTPPGGTVTMTVVRGTETLTLSTPY